MRRHREVRQSEDYICLCLLVRHKKIVPFINVATFHFKIPSYFRVKIGKILKIQTVKSFWIVYVYTHRHTHTNSTFPQINDNTKWRNFPQFSANNCMFKRCSQHSGIVHQYSLGLLHFYVVSNSLASPSWISSWGWRFCTCNYKHHFQNTSTCCTCGHSGIKKVVSTWPHQQEGNNPNDTHRTEQYEFQSKGFMELGQHPVEGENCPGVGLGEAGNFMEKHIHI